MAKKYKPIYTCDGCGEEFEDPSKVRCFNGYVTDGEGKLVPTMFNNSSNNFMVCINCIPQALDFNNDNSEERGKLLPLEIKNEEEIKKENLNEIKEEILNEINKIIKNHEIFKNKESLYDQQFNQNYHKVKTIKREIENLFEGYKQYIDEKTKNLITKEDILKEEVIEDNDILKEEVKPELDLLTKENVEDIINEITTSESEELEKIPEAKNEYILFQKIQDIEDADNAAIEYGYKDSETLKNDTGVELIGVFIPSGSMLESIPQDDNYKLTKIKFVNQLFFGIPNIVENDLLSNGEFAIATKKDLKLEVKPIDYEPSSTIEEEINNEEKTLKEEVTLNNKSTLSNFLKDFKKDFVKGSNNDDII